MSEMISHGIYHDGGMKTQNGIIYSGHSSARDNNCER